MKRTNDSKALREVWAWKQEAYMEVSGLSLESAIKKRLSDSVGRATSLKKSRKTGESVLAGGA